VGGYVSIPPLIKQGCVFPFLYDFLLILINVLRRAVKIEGQNSNFIALIVNDNSGWLEGKLQRALDFLELLMPGNMEPYESKGKLNFKSLHCDIWNRYSENVKISLSIKKIF
jgi:hypothetical protein